VTAVLTPAIVPDQVEDLRHLLERSDILAGILAAERLRGAALAGDLSSRASGALVRVVGEEGDYLARAGAMRALGGVPGPAIDAALLHALRDPGAGIAEHAAWALADRPAVAEAVGPLVGLVARGGFGAVVATATLERWMAGGSTRTSREVWVAIASAEDDARPRLVEVLGLCRDPVAGPLLLSLVRDTGERSAVRVAATMALGRFPGRPVRRALRALEGDDGDAVVRSAARRTRSRLSPPARARGPAAGRGVGVAQVMLQGQLDADLTAAGSGDSGGLVTLLVNLAYELAAQPGVRQVLTLGRERQGRAAGPSCGPEELGPSSVLARAEFGPPGPMPAAELWAHRVEIEAELARLLRATADIDVVHLRATDGGAWAAMNVCRELALPYVFTVAPDPHAVIAAAERAGTLTRDSLGAADAAEHWWFRVGLLGELVAGAAGLAVFPRPGGTRRLSALVGIDLDKRAPQVVPEGASLRAPRSAAADLERVHRGADLPPVLTDLVAAVSALGPQRRGLPLLVTAGRLHPVKGVDRLVEAWAGEPALRDAFNLVVVGGDLRQPSPVEQVVLAAVHAALDRHPGSADGVVMLGARPHLQLAVVLAAAHAGVAPFLGPDGVYACASVKEEFGLAIVEALAAGLAVLAPDDGGPPTYVEDGVTGVLVDTTSPIALRAGIARAASLRVVPGRSARARSQVAAHASLTTMAGALTELYTEAART